RSCAQLRPCSCQCPPRPVLRSSLWDNSQDSCSKLRATSAPANSCYCSTRRFPGSPPIFCSLSIPFATVQEKPASARVLAPIPVPFQNACAPAQGCARRSRPFPSDIRCLDLTAPICWPIADILLRPRISFPELPPRLDPFLFAISASIQAGDQPV